MYNGYVSVIHSLIHHATEGGAIRGSGRRAIFRRDRAVPAVWPRLFPPVLPRVRVASEGRPGAIALRGRQKMG